MDSFEYLALILAIPLGLVIVEIAQGLSTALRRRDSIRVGFCTPLLSLLLVQNTALVFFEIFDAQKGFEVSIFLISFALLVSIGYYISASFLVPDSPADGLDLDDWFMRNRKISLGLTVLLSFLVDFLFFTSKNAFENYRLTTFIFVIILFLPLVAAVFARSKKIATGGLVLSNLPFLAIAAGQMLD